MKKIIPRILINDEIIKSVEQIINYRKNLVLFQQFENGNLYVILNHSDINIFKEKPYIDSDKLLKDYYSLFDPNLKLFNKDIINFWKLLSDLQQDTNNSEKLNELLSYEIFLIYLINSNAFNLLNILKDNSLEIHKLLSSGNFSVLYKNRLNYILSAI